MRELSKGEAIKFIDEHAAVLDAPSNPVNPFASSVWLKHFVAQVATEDWTVLAPTSEHGSSLMLLYRDRQAPFKCEALTNYYSSLFSPLASTETDRARAVTSLVQQLGQYRPRLRTAKFAPLGVESPDTRHLEAALTEQGWYVRRYACFGNWSLPCEGMTFDGYMSTRDSQLRHTFERKSKKLQTTGQLQILLDPKTSTARWTRSSRSIRRAGSSLSLTPTSYANGLGYAQNADGCDWASRASMECPIAAQFWFTTGRRRTSSSSPTMKRNRVGRQAQC
jgi:hypothetical protein